MVQERLARYIREMGIKQTVISQKTGISRVILSAIMTGRRKLTADEYAKIVVAIGKQPNDFMRLEQERR